MPQTLETPRPTDNGFPLPAPAPKGHGAGISHPGDTLRFAHYDALVDEAVAGAARDELTRGSS
jgi:hypothetical protein